MRRGGRDHDHFVEVLFAPGYAPDALDALARKQALRILQDGERRKDTPGERDFRRVLGGLLVQDRDVDTQERDAMSVASGEVSDETWEDLVFANGGRAPSSFMRRAK